MSQHCHEHVAYLAGCPLGKVKTKINKERKVRQVRALQITAPGLLHNAPHAHLITIKNKKIKKIYMHHFWALFFRCWSCVCLLFWLWLHRNVTALETCKCPMSSNRCKAHCCHFWASFPFACLIILGPFCVACAHLFLFNFIYLAISASSAQSNNAYHVLQFGF